MKLLRELLKEIWSDAGRGADDEMVWQRQAASGRMASVADAPMEYWIVSPDGKKYGPFKSSHNAKMFFAQRPDVHRGSRLKSAPKGSKI